MYDAKLIIPGLHHICGPDDIPNLEKHGECRPRSEAAEA